MALSATFSTISSGQTDANSPLDEVLMDQLRQNIQVVAEWLGYPTYTPSTSHSHNGVDSKVIDGATLFKISTASAAGDAVIDLFDITTSYAHYVIKYSIVEPSVDQEVFAMQVFQGSTLPSTASYAAAGNRMSDGGTPGTVAFTGATAWRMGTFNVGSTANAGSCSGTINLYRPSFPGKHHVGDAIILGIDNGLALQREVIGMSHKSTATITGVRFFFENGNVQEGKFVLFGYKS